MEYHNGDVLFEASCGTQYMIILFFNGSFYTYTIENIKKVMKEGHDFIAEEIMEKQQIKNITI